MHGFLERTRREYDVPPSILWTAMVLCVVAGLIVASYFGLPNLNRARSSTRWATTEGRVLVSEVGRKTERNGEHRYFTQIRYSYSVDGHRYESKTVWVGDDYFSSRPGSHEDVVRRYPVGARVIVHYDPARPRIAVLESGPFPSNYGVFVAGLALIGVGAWLARLAVKESRKRKSSVLNEGT